MEGRRFVDVMLGNGVFMNICSWDFPDMFIRGENLCSWANEHRLVKTVLVQMDYSSRKSRVPLHNYNL